MRGPQGVQVPGRLSWSVAQGLGHTRGEPFVAQALGRPSMVLFLAQVLGRWCFAPHVAQVLGRTGLAIAQVLSRLHRAQRALEQGHLREQI